MKPMSMRQRMLAVNQRRAHDRIPFAIYEILVPPQQVLQHLGRGCIGIIRFCPIYRVEHALRHNDRAIFKGGL